MLIPILPLFAGSFEVSYGLVGLVLASQGIGNLIGDVPAGMLESRIGQRRSMLLGIATVTISVLAMSWAQSVPELVVYGLLSGLGMALFNISRFAYITNTTSVHRRGRAIAIFGGIMRIGTFGGPLIGGAIGLWLGLRAPFVLYAIVAGAALVLVAIFAGDTGEVAVVTRGGVRGHSSHLWGVVKEHHHNLTTAGSGMLMAQMIRSGRQIVVPLYGSEVLGLDVQQIGLIISMSAAIDMCMFYPAGIIMDRYGRKFAYVPSFLLQALGMALIPFTAGFAGLLFATLIVGFGNGLGSGTMMTLGADLAPHESVGEFLGVWRLIGDTGQAAAPIIVGTVADLVGFAAATWVIAGAGSAAAAILGLAVPETLSPNHRVPKRPLPRTERRNSTSEFWRMSFHMCSLHLKRREFHGSSAPKGLPSKQAPRRLRSTDDYFVCGVIGRDEGANPLRRSSCRIGHQTLFKQTEFRCTIIVRAGQTSRGLESWNHRQWPVLDAGGSGLEQDYDVVMVDARGHGQSTAPETGYGPESCCGFGRID